MGKTDRGVLITNEQHFGDIGDPYKLQNSIEHAYDKIDENDDEYYAAFTEREGNHPGRWQGLEPGDFNGGSQALRIQDIEILAYYGM